MNAEFVKYWFLRFNIARPMGYYFIFNFGFTLSAGMYAYLAKNNPSYLSTMPVPTGGWVANTVLQLILAIILTYYGNKHIKVNKNEIKT